MTSLSILFLLSAAKDTSQVGTFGKVAPLIIAIVLALVLVVLYVFRDKIKNLLRLIVDIIKVPSMLEINNLNDERTPKSVTDSVKEGQPKTSASGNQMLHSIESDEVHENPSGNELPVLHNSSPVINCELSPIGEDGVTVNISYSPDSAVLQYSLDQIKWDDLLEPVYHAKKNGRIWFRAINGEKSIVIDVILDNLIVPAPSIVVNDRKVRIECRYKNAQIYYTLNGALPTSDSKILYENELELSQSCTIKCIATIPGWTDSSEVERPITIIPTKEERIRCFTAVNKIIGISYRGEGHVKNGIPCQDCHRSFDYNGWSIAIVSDGAGSAKNSHFGSEAVCKAFEYYFKDLIDNNETISAGNVLGEKEWDIIFRGLLHRFQEELYPYGKTPQGFKDLGATIMVLIASQHGYMMAHVGDGRGAVKVNGKWQTTLIPHKGEEANQTIFSTTIRFSEKPMLQMSGVYVPETKSCEVPIEAFVLMSDGCENALWNTYRRIDLPDGDFKIKDINEPRDTALNQLLSIVEIEDNTEKKAAVLDYITSYNREMTRETDDKTIVIGIL